MATAVLPVWRSPMISSRWPRPTGIRRVDRLEAGLHRLVHRLARDDARRLDVDAAALGDAAIGPLPSIGLPSASTTRPSRPLPTGTSTMAPVRLTVSPSRMLRSSPKITTPTLSLSRFSAMPLTPASGTRPSRRPGPVEAVDAGDAVADREHLADLGDVGLGAEVGDLLLEDGRDLGGADIHQRAPSSPARDAAAWSSTTRRSSASRRVTTRPPIRLGSTRVVRLTARPA